MNLLMCPSGTQWSVHVFILLMNALSVIYLTKKNTHTQLIIVHTVNGHAV